MSNILTKPIHIPYARIAAGALALARKAAKLSANASLRLLNNMYPRPCTIALSIFLAATGGLHWGGVHVGTIVSVATAIREGKPMDGRRVVDRRVISDFGRQEYVVYDAENYRISFGFGKAAKAQYQRVEIGSVIVGNWYRKEVSYDSGFEQQ